MKQPVFLRIYRDGKVDSIKQFTDAQIVIGKNTDVQVSLVDESISPLHAVIEERDSGYYISDLGSKLGTYRNGHKLFDEPLASGDEIQVGPYRIEFFIGVPKPVAPPKGLGGADISEAPPEVTAARRPETSPPPIERPKHVEKTKTFQAASLAAQSAPVKTGRLKDSMRKSRGGIVEVVVAWGDRVIDTRHYDASGEYFLATGKVTDTDIVVPLLGAGRSRFQYLKIAGQARIRASADMTGEVYRDDGELSFADLKRKNRMVQVGQDFEFDLQQGETARIGLHGDTMNIFIRYVNEVPKPLIGPVLDLSTSETTALLMAVAISALLAIYMAFYTPEKLAEEEDLEEPIRKAVVVFNVPKAPPEIVKVEEEPKEKKLVKVDMKQEQTTTKPDPGKAAELRPSAQNKKSDVISSTIKQGGAVKTSPKQGSNMKSEKPDVTKMGLLSTFGGGGARSQLDKSTSGAGDLVGEAAKATGAAGFDSNRAGDDLGSRLKNVGAGGKGAATYGVSGGVGTSGKGTGTYGGGTGGFGKRGKVDLNIGDSEAEFSGSIDREAIRRVIRAHVKEIEYCYNQALRKNSDAYGKVEIQWNIIDGGRVTKAKPVSNTVGDKEMGNCIARVIGGLIFEAPPPDQEAVVTYPFVFSSQ